MRAEIKLDLLTGENAWRGKNVCRLASQMRCLGCPTESEFTAGQEFRGMHRILIVILFLQAIITSKAGQVKRALIVLKGDASIEHPGRHSEIGFITSGCYIVYFREVLLG